MYSSHKTHPFLSVTQLSVSLHQSNVQNYTMNSTIHIFHHNFQTQMIGFTFISSFVLIFL